MRQKSSAQPNPSYRVKIFSPDNSTAWLPPHSVAESAVVGADKAKAKKRRRAEAVTRNAGQ